VSGALSSRWSWSKPIGKASLPSLFTYQKLSKSPNGSGTVEDRLEEGSKVALKEIPYIQGIVKKLPRSIGRTKPRCLIETEDGERWVGVDELVEVTDAPDNSEADTD